MTEIALPDNNEQEFLEVASRLGIKKLCFLYDFNEYASKAQKNTNLAKENKNIALEIGFIVNQKNIGRASQQSSILVAKSSDKNQPLIEGKQIKIIYGFEEIHKKDYLHQRASGLNQVICGLAKKNNIAIGFSYSSLHSKADAALLMGRLMQNISLCQKYNVKTKIASFSSNPFDLRPPHDLISLFSMLGMESKRITESLDSAL